MPVPAAGTPSELPLVSPNSEVLPPFSQENGADKVQMKKQLGLLEGVSIILGIIFGSGNFSNNKSCASYRVRIEMHFKVFGSFFSSKFKYKAMMRFSSKYFRKQTGESASTL